MVRSCLSPKSSQLMVYVTPVSMSRTLSFSVMYALPSSLCRPYVGPVELFGIPLT